MSLTAVDSAMIERILRGFRTEAHVRIQLPGGGTINLDRKLPFLFVHRQPDPSRPDSTAELITGEASYLTVRGDLEQARDIVQALSEAGTAETGSFLVLELWAGPEDSTRFVVHAPARLAATTVEALRSGLERLADSPLRTRCEVNFTDARHPPDLPELLNAQECWESGCLLIGLEVPPLYRGPHGEKYPVFRRRMRALLSPVLRQTAFDFARVQTRVGVESYRALGPRSFGTEVFRVDEQLAEIEGSYDMLLTISPMNSGDEWRRFRAAQYDRTPDFNYRLLPFDPDLLKRRLFNLELDDIADPAMAFLLRDKRDELDRQITMLSERNTADFLYSSMRLYGAVDDMLLDIAREVLASVAVPVHEDDDDTVGAEEFARRARAEIDTYRESFPDMAADVQVRPDLTGLLVSRGNLLIGDSLRLRPHRVEALLHHEVGTHVLTFYNGRSQPLRQLSTGLADYDELQEGIAVFTEYLAGGLDAGRLRVLAARVVAGHSVEQRATFIETFRLLTREYGLMAGSAFDIAERVHASGGFTRDIIYLRGVIQLLEHIRAGGDLAALYIGKLAAKHIDIIAELRERGFLSAPPLTPRVLQTAEARDRIQAVRRGLSLPDLISHPE
jgi:uncharacterized protein (TIGR02421 family)